MIQVFCDECGGEIKTWLKVHMEVKPPSTDYRIPVPEREQEAEKEGDFCSVGCAVQWLRDSPWGVYGSISGITILGRHEPMEVTAVGKMTEYADGTFDLMNWILEGDLPKTQSQIEAFRQRLIGLAKQADTYSYKDKRERSKT